MGGKNSVQVSNDNKWQKAISSMREQNGIGAQQQSGLHEIALRHIHEKMTSDHKQTQEILIFYYMLTFALATLILIVGYVLLKFFKKMKKFEQTRTSA